jgi:hypothetical protein
MRAKLYTLLGFVTWEGLKLVLRRKVSQNRTAVAAGATVALVVIGGFVAARSGSSEE